MNWFLKLFNKKSQEITPIDNEESKTKWEGYDAFEKGQECYANRLINEALIYFDKALECGFEEYFHFDAAKIFGFRGGCLQTLNYDYDAIKDFDKAILFSPKDCNNYFSRSLSKSAIMDYDGAISDIKKAVEISKEDSELNRIYNDEAKKMGHTSISALYQPHLVRYELALSTEKIIREKIENAALEDKEFLENKYITKRKEKILQQIKRRYE